MELVERLKFFRNVAASVTNDDHQIEKRPSAEL